MFRRSSGIVGILFAILLTACSSSSPSVPTLGNQPLSVSTAGGTTRADLTQARPELKNCPPGTVNDGAGNCISNGPPAGGGGAGGGGGGGSVNCDNPNVAKYDTRCGGDPRLKPQYYGSQGVCSLGFLYFSDGCEDDSVATNSAYNSWFDIVTKWLNSGYVLYIHDSHFWNKHLACYLSGSNQNYDSAVSQDFYSIYLTGVNIPAQGAFADFSLTYSGLYTKYRLTTVQTGAYYTVGTAYIPGRPNCPGY